MTSEHATDKWMIADNGVIDLKTGLEVGKTAGRAEGDISVYGIVPDRYGKNGLATQFIGVGATNAHALELFDQWWRVRHSRTLGEADAFLAKERDVERHDVLAREALARLTMTAKLEITLQAEKWGLQEHDNAMWWLIAGEEVGEAAKAVLEGRYEEAERELAQAFACFARLLAEWRLARDTQASE